MKQVYTLLLLCSFSFLLQAQEGRGGKRGGRGGGGDRTPIVVKGKVIDQNKEALEFATVSLYRLRDSSLVDGTITDQKGIFKFETRPGKYYATIDFLSFTSKTISDIMLTPRQAFVELGEIILEEDAEQLEEVEVIAERSSMELKLDKRVFNVGKDLANTGNSAAEILDNVPSVQVDVDGNVSLRGSENVRILIDGRPSGLVGISSTDALRQMQGDMVQAVEVITNPSAKYEAEGQVGIINIILKKEKKKGVNGSFGLTAGHPANYGASYSLNFRREKMNVFSNFGVNYRKYPGGGFEIRKTAKDGNTLFRSDREQNRGGLGGNIQLGMDYYLNEKNTLTVSGLYRLSDRQNPASVVYQDYNEMGIVDRISTRINDETEESINLEGALSYEKKFDRKGQKWTVDFKYIESDDTEIADYTETDDISSDFFLQQRSNSTEDERNILFQSDYIHPFSKDSKLEMGLRANFRTIENDYLVEQLDENDTWQVYENLQGQRFDDDFRYLENIYAAYTTYGNKINKFSYQFGLRAEYSDIETVSQEVSNPRDYLNWFPSAFLSYQASEKNQFQLSYSRRISRPRFWYLLPFLTFTDIRNNFGGNPDLNPEYTDSYEAGYLKFFEKGSFLTSVYYRYITDNIQRISVPEGGGIATTLPVNLGVEHNYGLEFNFSYDISKKWRINANANLYRSRLDNTNYTGEFAGLVRDKVVFNTMSARFTNRMTIFKDVNFQTDFNYRAPSNTAQGRRLAMYVLNTALAKDILKGKGTLSLSVKDIFNSRIRRSIRDIPGLYSESEFQWRAQQQFVLNFIYRLNQKKRRGGDRQGRGGGDFDGGDF